MPPTTIKSYFRYMIIKPGVGIDQLKFGMQQAEVEQLLGKPDKSYTNEEDEDELILQYNKLKLRLTFYKQEDNKLGYITSSNPDLTFKDQKLIDTPIEKATKEIFAGYSEWDTESYDSFETYFNEEYWVVLSVEYDVINGIELGVPFDDSESYTWPA